DVGRRDLREPDEALAEGIAPVREPRRVVARRVFELSRRDRLRRGGRGARQESEQSREPTHGSSVAVQAGPRPPGIGPVSFRGCSLPDSQRLALRPRRLTMSRWAVGCKAFFKAFPRSRIAPVLFI